MTAPGALNETVREYAAQGFPPELKGKVAPGRLEVSAAGVVFRSEAHRADFPWEGLKLRAGGFNNAQLFLEHPNLPGWAVAAGVVELRADPSFQSRPEFAGFVKKAQGQPRIVPVLVTLFLLFVALVAAGLVAIYVNRARIVEAIVDKIPTTLEEKWGDQGFEQFKREGKIAANSPWEPALQSITARLLPAVEGSGYNFKFHIMNDTNLNAFAIPGGHVVVLTGLLEAAENAEEVAGVLAHELAHVTRRHSLRQLVQSAGVMLLVQALIGDASGLAGVVTEGSRFLLQQRFSRDFEREADDEGWQYLLAAEVDPRGMTRFFERLRRLEEGQGGAALGGSMALLNTHPATDERIQNLESKWQATANKERFRALPALKRGNP